MKEIIIEYLKKLEKNRDIKIIYACESGSRAWGFDSINSDWDVRFIYRMPIEKYLSIKNYKDAFDLHVKGMELDFGGWDVRKAAGLLKNYNGALVEWLNSPKKYIETNSSLQLTALASNYFNAKAALFHYHNLAYSIYKKYIQDKNPFILKKMLYVIRPIICAKYIIEKKRQPYTNFVYLIEYVSSQLDIDPEIMKIIKEIVKQKREAKELGEVKHDFSSRLLIKWIEKELEHIYNIAMEMKSPDLCLQELDNWVIDTLKEDFK